MTTNPPKPPRVFVCITCDFKCSNKKDYNRHLSTAKHNKMTNSNINTGLASNKFSCGCGNEYKYRQGLHLHKKKCTHNNKTNEIQYDEVHNPVVEPTSEASTVLRLLKQNDEFKQLMAEQYNVMTERHNENVALQEKNQELNQQLIAAIKDTTTRPTTVGPTNKQLN